MSIISFNFLFFVLATIGLYFVIPKKMQWVILLIANFVFYISISAELVLFIIFTIISTFAGALCIEHREIFRNKVRLCALVLVCNFGIWIVLKYSNFILESFNDVFALFSIGFQFPYLNFILPIGISFYTFQAMGYLIDVYRGKYKAETNIFKFALFLSFFPHIIQGPFSRFDELGKSLFAQHSFSYDRLCEGLRRILWGYFKKLIIADKIGISVNEIFSNWGEYDSIHIIAVVVFYGIQIYADFSGYMDIMCGISHIMGIDLAENFNQPYFSKSIEEFWRRWHITLGRWFRDYLFFPVSMSRYAQKLGKKSRKKFGPRIGKLIPSYFALIFVWTVTGLWHGASWTYLIWGYFNLFVITLSMQLAPSYSKIKKMLRIKDGWIWSLWQIVRTFMLVCLFRFFSRADNVDTALEMLKKIFTIDLNDIAGYIASPSLLFPGMSVLDIIVFGLGTLTLFAVDIFREIGKWEKIKSNVPMVVRDFIYTALIFSIILFAGGNNDLVGGFLYARF